MCSNRWARSGKPAPWHVCLQYALHLSGLLSPRQRIQTARWRFHSATVHSALSAAPPTLYLASRACAPLHASGCRTDPFHFVVDTQLQRGNDACRCGVANARRTEEKVAQLSTYSFTKTGYTPGVPRLGVPAYSYHSEGLHGIRDSSNVCVRGAYCLPYHSRHATLPGLTHCFSGVHSPLWPQVTGMAATGNLSRVYEMAVNMGIAERAVSNAAKAEGKIFDKGAGLSLYGPTINIIRDPRWGRSQESVSEDPLVSRVQCVHAYRLVACQRA